MLVIGVSVNLYSKTLAAESFTVISLTLNVFNALGISA
jgi:hypothetical protein